jgi:redox-sensitive bicupin YhaK (pirin superfamily)
VFSPTLYVDAQLAAGTVVEVPDEHEQRACYVAQGRIEVDGQDCGVGQFVVLASGAGPVAMRALEASRVMLAGGAPLDGPRYIDWNFVSSSRARIETARRDWREQRFAPVPGDAERIPLPDE